MQIYGYIEFRVATDWLAVVTVSSLLLDHSDLNACLFGVDNYARFAPLFADRGIPVDASTSVMDDLGSAGIDVVASHASWALFSELQQVDWDVPASGHDERVTELDAADPSRPLTKWLHHIQLEWIREALLREPDKQITLGTRIFKRVVLRRRDSLVGTDFPLVMDLMACLAKRFGDDAVRLVVWFD